MGFVLNVQGHHPEKRIFTSKWTIVWHQIVGDASFHTPLQSLDCPNAMEEEQPSLEMRLDTPIV